MTLTTVVPSFYHCIMVVPSMHKNDPNRQTNLLVGIVFSGFLSQALLLVELFCSPLCSDLFLCLQANFELKQMQENHFHHARRQWGHHSIIAGSIGAQERISTLRAHLCQRSHPLTSSRVHSPGTAETFLLWAVCFRHHILRIHILRIICSLLCLNLVICL